MSDGFVDAWGGRGGAVLTRMLFKAKADAVHMLVIGSRVRTRAAGDDADPAISRALVIKQRERACAEVGGALWSVCR